MKTTSENKIEKVQALFAIIEQRKELEKAEKELKKEIRELMGDALLLEAGALAVVVSERSRRDIDKEAIAADHGVDFLAQYTKTTSFEIMEVKKTKSSLAG